MTEHEHQKALFKWARLMCSKHPELKRMFAIPNGGHRMLQVAAKLKLEGVKPGVPDICLPVANKEFSSLFIELKTEKGRLTINQEEWLNGLARLGNKAVMCRGWENAKDTILDYIN